MVLKLHKSYKYMLDNTNICYYTLLDVFSFIFTKKIKICMHSFIFKISLLPFYVEVNDFKKNTIFYLLKEGRTYMYFYEVHKKFNLLK